MIENEKANQEIKRIEAELNALIVKCSKATGFVYLTDKLHNDFIIRITEPIKLTAFIPSKREDKENEI